MHGLTIEEVPAMHLFPMTGGGEEWLYFVIGVAEDWVLYRFWALSPDCHTDSVACIIGPDS